MTPQERAGLRRGGESTPAQPRRAPTHPGGHWEGLGWDWPRRDGMEFPGGPRARGWNRLGGGGRCGGWKTWVCGRIQSDLGSQGGGEGVRLPGRLRLGRGDQGPGAVSGVAMQTQQDRTLGSEPGAQVPHCAGPCTCWELSTEPSLGPGRPVALPPKRLGALGPMAAGTGWGAGGISGPRLWQVGWAVALLSQGVTLPFKRTQKGS